MEAARPGTEASERLSSQTHLAQLTDTPGPAHRHTWLCSLAHLAQLTDTPGPAHLHTWPSSQAHLALLQAYR